jgi:hypothetical protein
MAVSFFLLLSSCSSIQAGLYSSFVNENNVEEIITNEKNIKIFLENVLDRACDYAISVHERTLTRGQNKKTNLMRHRFYVIKALPSDEYRTLSFYGTKFAFYSQGVWILNSNSDVSSYEGYLSGKNKWDVAVIDKADDIDTAATAKKIIWKIENRVRYYYKDHVTDKPGVDNCNTAVKETLVRKHPSGND